MAAEAGITTLFTSEPTTADTRVGECTVVGRYTIGHGNPPAAARLFVQPAPWARSAAWASWTAKGLVKPILGTSYARVADWLLSSSISDMAARQGRSN